MATLSYKLGSPTLQVLIPLFPDFNTFDANGPIEVLSAVIRNPELPSPPPFKLTIAGASELTRSVEGVRIARDISLTNAIARLSEWDVLLVPGGVAGTILATIATWKEAKENNVPGDEFMELINQYMERKDGVTLTVCTASLFLGALGKLVGRKATTHWASLAALKRLCAEITDANTEVVRARWVESGKDGKSDLPRLITAGGVSCGIDATFHLLDLTVGKDIADSAATRLDYERRGQELQADYIIPS